MPQIQLPMFPHGTTHINDELGFERRGNRIAYLNGHLPVYSHDVNDLAGFRFIATQLITNGVASYGQIAKAFGVPARTLKRYSQRYRERGMEAFFKGREKRHGHRLTAERLAQAQSLLDQGVSVPQISQQMGVLATTLHKAIDQGRLRVTKKKT